MVELLIVQLLQYAVTAAFVALALVAVRDWLLKRDARIGYVALAMSMLGLVVLGGRLEALLGYYGPALQVPIIVVFQLSAYALLLFRNSFIPMARPARLVAVAVLAGTAGGAIIAGAPQPGARPTSAQSLASLAVILAWCATVVEPTFRFALASRHLPSVQRRRLRALSLGYGAIIAILLVSSVGGATRSLAFQVVTQLAALAIAPLLYAAFAPPQWLRRAWREAEEEGFRLAINELLLFAPSREVLAERGLDWAVRLVGADAGEIRDGDGTRLAVRAGSEHPPGPGSPAKILVPLTLENGTGELSVTAGAFTPLFGSDEANRLVQYGASLTAALDRARVSERMLALEEMKSRFLRLASHELRGPLSLVRGYLSMLGEGSLSARDLESVVPVMMSKVTQMTGMLNEMLETARLEDERLELKAEDFDLRDAAAAVIDSYKPLTGPSHPLVVDLPPVSVPVRGDRARVETIISNLVDNAIKYSPAGGTIACGIQTEGPNAILTVSDEGVGIAPEDINILFTRFGRISNPTTTSIPGTGLGLYLARELARRHGGDITAESTPGHGSSFNLWLPGESA